MEFNAYFLKAACAIGAGLCMGIGAIGPALAKVMQLARLWRAWPVSLRLPALCVPT